MHLDFFGLAAVLPLLAKSAHLVQAVSGEQHGTHGAEEEGDHGKESQFTVGRREGERQDHESDGPVLDGRLQGNGDDLGPAWKM